MKIVDHSQLSEFIAAKIRERVTGSLDAEKLLEVTFNISQKWLNREDHRQYVASIHHNEHKENLALIKLRDFLSQEIRIDSSANGIPTEVTDMHRELSRLLGNRGLDGFRVYEALNNIIEDSDSHDGQEEKVQRIFTNGVEQEFRIYANDQLLRIINLRGNRQARSWIISNVSAYPDRATTEKAMRAVENTIIEFEKSTRELPQKPDLLQMLDGALRM